MSDMALPGDGKQSAGDKKFAAAMRVATEVMVSTRSLLDQIRPFTESDDPFAALVEAHDRAQAFEDDQETRIFLGPPNGK